MDVDPEKVDKLLHDVDGAKIYLVPFNPKKRFTSTKDGRPWANIMESKHSAWSGDQYMAKCRGSFKCFNLHCPYFYSFTNVTGESSHRKDLARARGQFSER